MDVHGSETAFYNNVIRKLVREILYFWKEIVFQRVLFYYALALSLEAFSIWIISLSICLYRYAKNIFGL